jgi:RNA polymerase primary sigma factor
MARRKVTRGAPPQLARSARDRARPKTDGGELATETATPEASVPVRAIAREVSERESEDGPNFLSLYFREMAGLDVMDPKAELEAATRIARLREEYWRSLLAFAPLAEPIVAMIESKLEAEDVPRAELAELRKAARGVREAGEGPARAEFAEACAALAAKMALYDVDAVVSDIVAADLNSLEAGDLQAVTALAPIAPADSAAFRAYAQRVRNASHALRAAKNAFVKANLRLVVSIARRFNHGRMPLQDLIQEGNIGLLKAVDRFDYRKGFRFSTYGSWWIRHAISRAVADKGREVRLPVHMIDAYHKVARARRELETKTGREPSPAQLAEHTGIAESKIEKMGGLLIEQPISLDRPVSGEDGRRMVELVEDPSADVPMELLESDALNDEVHHLISMLRPIEADILRKRFGLEEEHELTLKEIGGQYHLSRERIRQLQEQALLKIRRELKRREMM